MTMMTVSWHAQQQRRAWLRALFLCAVLLAFALPLIWTLLASLDVTPDNATTPATWQGPLTLANYAEIGIAEPAFAQELLTSTLLSTMATVITSVVAFFAAYGLARSRARR